MTVATRQQFAGAVSGATQYSGFFDAASKILRNDGFASLYRGFLPRLLQSPLAVVQWVTYEAFKEQAAKPRQLGFDSSTAKYAALFTGSRCLVTFVKSPLEIVKERMQVERSLAKFDVKKRSMMENIKFVYHTDGVRGLFRGLHVNLLRDIPVAWGIFLGNDYWTHVLTANKFTGFGSFFAKDKELAMAGKGYKLHVNVVAGFLSGLFAALVTHPFDVAKTILQTQSMSRLLPNAAPPKYRGLWDVLKRVTIERGPKFLFTGFLVRAAHISVGSMLYLPIYRFIKLNWGEACKVLFPSLAPPPAPPTRRPGAGPVAGAGSTASGSVSAVASSANPMTSGASPASRPTACPVLSVDQSVAGKQAEASSSSSSKHNA